MRVTLKSLLGAAALTLAFAAPAAAETDIKFTLDWVFQGPTSPFLLAVQKGYYKAEGLNVSVDAGQGSAGAVQRVATGAYQMGFADINALVEYNVKYPDQPIKVVMMVYDFPPFAVHALKKSGIAKPKDIEGRKLGAPIFDASFKLFPAFAQATGIDQSKVTKINMQPPLREPSLINGSVDVISGHNFSSILDLKAKGVPASEIVTMTYSDFGMDFYGNAIIAAPEMLQKPEVLKGFLRATLKAWKDVIANPDEGIKAAKARDPLIDDKVEMERLLMCLKNNVLTPWVKTNGMGDVDMARLQRANDAVAAANNLPTSPKASDLFTNAYLPPQAERMVAN